VRVSLYIAPGFNLREVGRNAVSINGLTIIGESINDSVTANDNLARRRERRDGRGTAEGDEGAEG
jgi:hypothetical protein